ncbi:MAG: deoxyribose-phosphate aldolase [Clostridia bacterium]|nr:deoxyribose-phosphate aldolase [Clostridia bacterium]
MQQVSGGTEPCAAGGSANLAKYIDHTLLKPEATRADIKRVCDEAKKYNTASVCVNPSWVGYVAEQLRGTSVNPCVVVGFPLGATVPAVKAAEAAACIAAGAKEVDMVMNIGAAKSGEWDLVLKDIQAVVAACKGKALLKVIIECCLLTDEEKVKACQVSKLAGADFVKTSTGFSTGGATVEDIRLMRATVGASMGVKASGGVRTKADAEAMIAAGASRIGASSSKNIVEGDTTAKACINCGACKNGGTSCPTGNAVLRKVLY